MYISERVVSKGGRGKASGTFMSKEYLKKKKKEHFTWTACGNCVENKAAGIKGNLLMVVGNSPLPATFQEETRRHVYKLLVVKPPLNRRSRR